MVMKPMAQIVGSRVSAFEIQTLNVWSRGRHGVLTTRTSGT
jgi:hypothetical protein